MNLNNALRNLLVSLSILGGTFAAQADAQININVSVAPPAPQYEAVPTMPSGYVWAPGYWGWSGERHVWVRGHSIAQREGYRWQPDRWDERDHRYHRTAGHWERDHDYKGPGKHKGGAKGHDKGWAKGHDKDGKD